jgi:hypothetical protein
MPEHQGGRGPKQGSPEDIAGIVGPDRHSRHGHRHRHDERHDPRLSVSKQQRDGDGERRRRVVAREGRIVRSRDEEVSGAGMRDVRTRPLPYVGDDLGSSERQQRAEAGGDDSVTAIDRAPLAPCQEDGREQRHEEHLGLHGEEAQRILQAVVVSGEPVQDLEGVEVDAGSVGTVSGPGP